MRGILFGVALVALCVAGPIAQEAVAPTTVPKLSDSEIERFLREARVLRTKSISKGVTGSLRATLTDGVITHDAQIQIIDEQKARFEAAGATEFNFRDSWKYNVAAYRIDRLLGLNLVPVSISRKWRADPGAYTWWVDDVMMDEGKRLKDKVQSPHPAMWNEEMQLVRLFDQLIYNVDRNMGNLLIGKDWRIWAIDHTRAFRTHDKLKSPANVTRCDRQVFERLKQLNRETLKREIGEFCTNYEIDGVLARRDAIVALLEKNGPGAIFDRRDK
jgi:hypothetical protein